MINVQAKPAAAASLAAIAIAFLAGCSSTKPVSQDTSPKTGDQPGGARYHGGNG